MRDFFKIFQNPKNKVAILDGSKWKYLRTKPSALKSVMEQLRIYPKTINLCIECLQELVETIDDGTTKVEDVGFSLSSMSFHDDDGNNKLEVVKSTHVSDDDAKNKVIFVSGENSQDGAMDDFVFSLSSMSFHDHG